MPAHRLSTKTHSHPLKLGILNFHTGLWRILPPSPVRSMGNCRDLQPTALLLGAEVASVWVTALPDHGQVVQIIVISDTSSTSKGYSCWWVNNGIETNACSRLHVSFCCVHFKVCKFDEKELFYALARYLHCSILIFCGLIPTRRITSFSGTLPCPRDWGFLAHL